MKRINEIVESIKKDYNGLLEFLKARYPLFHRSNFFMRDFSIRNTEIP